MIKGYHRNAYDTQDVPLLKHHIVTMYVFAEVENILFSAWNWISAVVRFRSSIFDYPTLRVPIKSQLEFRYLCRIFTRVKLTYTPRMNEDEQHAWKWGDESHCRGTTPSGTTTFIIGAIHFPSRFSLREATQRAVRREAIAMRHAHSQIDESCFVFRRSHIGESLWNHEESDRDTWPR